MENLKAKFIRYTAFSMIAMVGVSIYILVDTYFIARALGAVGLAALNYSIVVFTLIHGTSLMIGIGGAIDSTVRRSADPEPDQNFWVNVLVIGAVFAAFFLALGIFAPTQVAKILGADAVTLVPTRIYTQMLLVFSPFFILNNITLAFMRNNNQPKQAMMAMIISSFANIILDYILMFMIPLGIFGAALATGLSPIISLGFMALHFHKKKFRLYLSRGEFQLFRIKRIMTLGFPSLISELASAVTLFAFNLVLSASAGYVGVAAYGVIANIAIVAIALLTGLAQGIQPLASQYYAVSDHARLKVILRYSLTTAILFSAIIYMIVLLFTDSIVAAFNDENNKTLALIAENGLKIYFSGFLFAGVNIAFIAFMGATTRTTRALAISVLRSCAVLLPVLLLMNTLYGIDGVWLSFPLTELLVMILAIAAWRSQRQAVS